MNALWCSWYEVKKKKWNYLKNQRNKYPEVITVEEECGDEERAKQRVSGGLCFVFVICMLSS